MEKANASRTFNYGFESRYRSRTETCVARPQTLDLGPIADRQHRPQSLFHIGTYSCQIKIPREVLLTRDFNLTNSENYGVGGIINILYAEITMDLTVQTETVS